MKSFLYKKIPSLNKPLSIIHEPALSGQIYFRMKTNEYTAGSGTITHNRAVFTYGYT
jgi:hypothetical protein